MKKQRSVSLRLRGRLLPILLVATVTMQLIDPYKGWMGLSIGLGLVWLVSYIWAKSLSRNLTLIREMRFGWAQVGDQLEERFTLVNQGWIPALWVEVQDHSDMPDYKASRVTGVEGTMRNGWHSVSMCTQRGLFTLGPTSLHTGDPFGMYAIRVDDPASTTLMVMPPVIPLPAIDVAPGGRTGQAQPRSNAPERTVSAGSVREWQPGDSLRYIHWRSYAKHNEPYVRIFDGTPAGDWWIFLDMDKNVQIGQGWDSTVEQGIILAASLADRGLQMRRAVGLVSNGKELAWLPPEQGANRRWEILRQLALVNPGERPLTEFFDRTRRSIARQSSLVIITPNVDPGWVQALIPLIWQGAVPTVLLLDPDSFEGEGPGAGRGKRSAGILSILADLGISRYLISRDLFDQPEAHPGQAGHWEWKITPTGRAIPVHQPSNAAWKVLG